MENHRLGLLELEEWRVEGDICARKRVNQQLSEEAVGKEKMSIITRSRNFQLWSVSQAMPSPRSGQTILHARLLKGFDSQVIDFRLSFDKAKTTVLLKTFQQWSKVVSEFANPLILEALMCNFRAPQTF